GKRWSRGARRRRVSTSRGFLHHPVCRAKRRWRATGAEGPRGLLDIETENRSAGRLRSTLQQLVGELVCRPDGPLRVGVEVRVGGFAAAAPVGEDASQMQD